MFKIPAEIKEIMAFFPGSFINYHNEIILEPKNNIYFSLENVKNKLELKCKLLEYTARPSCKGLQKKWQKYFRDKFNNYFKTDFNDNEMMDIYTYLGNGVNREKTIKFIKSGFDLDVLTQGK